MSKEALIYDGEILKIDHVHLRQQYNWLLKMPHSEEREGLLNFVENLLFREACT